MLSFLRNLKSGEADGQQGHRSEHAGREVRHLGRLQDDAAHAHLARREQTIAHLLVQGDGRRQQRLHRVVERAVQDKHMQRPLAKILRLMVDMDRLGASSGLSNRDIWQVLLSLGKKKPSL